MRSRVERETISKVSPKRDWNVLAERLMADLDPEETFSGDQVRDLVRQLMARQVEILMESENRFRAVFENTLEAIILSDTEEKGRVISANQAAFSMFGYSKEEFIGIERTSIIVMSDPSIRRIAEQLSLSGRASGMMTYKRKDGTRFTGEISVALFPDRSGKQLSVSVIRDITDRKMIEEKLTRYSEDLEYLVKERTIELEERNVLLQEEISERRRYEEALKESEEKYRQLVENANEAILVAQDGMLRFFNRKTSEFTGYTEEELASIPFTELIHPEDRDMVLDHYQKRIRGEKVPSTYEFRIRDKQQNTKWLEINSIRISWQGRPATLNFLMDITDWKKAEREKEIAEDQLLQSQKMEALGRFAGGIAHDLNNILYPIVVNTETLLGDAASGTESHQMLEEVLEAAYRQKDLVKQILSFSRRSEQKFVPIRIIPLIQETIKFIRSSLPSTIEMWNHISTRTDAVMGDSTQIHQVIMNLCKNAADALESRKGLIEISLEDETVSDHPDMRSGDYLRLIVRDTGCGMEPDMLDRIFEPFFTTKAKDKGIGMGLTVVHGIIKNHGGTIMARSEPGKGSEFIVYLPKYKGEMLKQATLFEDDSQFEGRKKILLVDDEEGILNSLQRALQKSGFDVVAEKDPMRALILFNRSPDEFSLVITDLTMPQVTGIEFTEKLIDVRPDIPVILCTGLSEGFDERDVKAMGIREVLMKPANMSELRDAVRRALGN
jgi:PAS domain S-box-containing protein